MKKDQTKKSFLSGQKYLIIALAVVFVILLVVYFAAVRPLLATKDQETKTMTQVWRGEKVDSSVVYLFDPIDRSKLDTVLIHNPANAEKGEEYVDWGLYHCTKDGEKSESGYTYEKDQFYLIGFEYAACSDDILPYLITDAGYPVSGSRVVDFADDETMNRFGLIGNDELEKAESVEKALENYTYYTIKSLSGASHTVVIGDRLASGRGYYARLIDEDEKVENGEKSRRSSIYQLNFNVLTGSVLDVVEANIIYPVNPSYGASNFSKFGIADVKVVRDDKGEPVYNENGEVKTKNDIRVYLWAVDVAAKDPFTQFAAMNVYKVEYPNGGYFGSTSFEGLFEVFTDMTGDAVVALAKPMEFTDEDGTTYTDYGFDAETYAKYGLSEDYTLLYYTYDVMPNEEGGEIDTYLHVSPLQPDGYYYAYSVLYNSICRVSPKTLYFLDWDVSTYLQSELLQINIDKVASVKVSGSYTDLHLDSDKESESVDVDLLFRMSKSGTDLVVNGFDLKNDGKALINTKNFRQLYKILLQVYLRDQADEKTVEEARKNAPVAEVQFVTRDNPVYVKNALGQDTSVIDYYLYSVTRTFRFYRLTEGRCLCTIEDISYELDKDGNLVYETDAEGNRVVKKVLAREESGTFFVTSSRVQQIVEVANRLYHGETIDGNQRG